MLDIRTSIVENIQKHCERGDWPSAIEEMERLFSINRDPHIRIRIGDARRKLNRHRDAVDEYIFAADLFAHEGFMTKALAQYSLALRLDSSNEYARRMRELVRKRAGGKTQKPETTEYRLPQPAGAAENVAEPISAFRLDWLAAVAARDDARGM